MEAGSVSLIAPTDRKHQYIGRIGLIDGNLITYSKGEN